jgi:ABC-2 type transport system ATP-binding protein
MAQLLEAESLTKFYRHNWTLRRICVLENLDLSVEEGEVFGLIGPNGAGKTTTFKLILGLLRPTNGAVRFRGDPLSPAARTEIGFLPEQPYFYDYLTVLETLDLYARLYGIDASARARRVAEVIEQVRLGHKVRASLRSLSKGTLQRVGIAQAILNRPRLVILDEPMSGLDPAGRRHMRELILSLRGDGTTVIFSSHILPDAEAVCDRVGILTGGKMREVIDLRRDRGNAVYTMVVREVDASVLARLEGLAHHPVEQNGKGWIVRLNQPETVAAALDVVRGARGMVESLTPTHPSLEERFLSHVGNETTLD